MNYLHPETQWELVRARQAEMLKEAQNLHLAEMAEGPKQNWWAKLRRPQAQAPALALNPNAAPKLR